jgi:deoxyribodipyrimidine photolyase-related protein
MTRNLVLVLGDQLDGQSAAFDGFDRNQDAILMIEAREEATYIPQHRKRLAFFFSAMRHFAAEQRKARRTVHYAKLDDPTNTGNFADEIARWYVEKNAERVVVLEPGDFRVKAILGRLKMPIEIREDRHFLCEHATFAAFSGKHSRPALETFYRFMRRRHRVLIEEDGQPEGGAWNFDRENRSTFGKKGPPPIPRPPVFDPDPITREVITMVERTFPDAPGSLTTFSLPVTRAQALTALDDFVRNRLDGFGTFQDAMHSGEPLLFHSQLSGPLNLHLLDPREVLEAVLAVGDPINAVEGFVRQVLGWREFVRGIYWRYMPDYADRNALKAHAKMPRFYWTGETDMRCLSEAIAHTIEHAYAHHIERLMVLGLFALLLGVDPYEVHRWHMSMFWDAVDWVSLPNTLGMSQHADGGVIGTKPYAASGAYIDRMSDHCRHCRYNPQQATGEQACPFTTLYWDFLARHRKHFAKNHRMRPAYANLDRKKDVGAIRRQADALKARL